MDMVKEEAPARAVEPLRASVRLSASRDRKTGKGVFPRIPATSPSSDRYEPVTLSAEATLYSFTIIHPNPKTGQKPFVLVYADFPEDTRVFGRLEMPDGRKPVIGMPLRVVAGDAGGDTDTNYVFEPLGDSQ